MKLNNVMSTITLLVSVTIASQLARGIESEEPPLSDDINTPDALLQQTRSHERAKGDDIDFQSSGQLNTDQITADPIERAAKPSGEKPPQESTQANKREKNDTQETPDPLLDEL